MPFALSFGGLFAQSLIDTSLIHHDRWREIALSSPADVNAGDRDFPILHKVTLSFHTTRPFIIRNAPALKADIRIFTDGGFDVLLPWMQLQTLRLETFEDVEVCLKILSQCSSMLHFQHEMVHAGSLTDAKLPRITLRNLESLNVAYTSVFPHLTLPRLRHLAWSKPIPPSIEHPRTLLDRSSCSLQSLSIFVHGNYRTRPEMLTSLFQLVPTVTTLRVELEQAELIVRALSPADTLPILHTLRIDAVHRWANYYGSLLNVLRSRRNALRSFMLVLRHDALYVGPRPIPEVTIAQFHDLAEGGLKCHIHLDDNPPVLDVVG